MSIVQKKKPNTAGYTLIEVLVSIAVFGIISVVMTGIVISMGSLSLTVDRRTDFLSELEGTATILKNEMRTAAKLGFCDAPTGVPASLYIVAKPNVSGSVKYFKVGTVQENRTTKLVLTQLRDVVGNTCNENSAPQIQKLTSDRIQIQNLSFIKSVKTSTLQNPDTIIYVSFEACDSDNIPRKTFSCESTQNPYRYAFAVSTRNF